MEREEFPIIFALSGRHRPAEVVLFEREAILLKQGREIKVRVPYGTITQVELLVPSGGWSRWLRMMGGFASPQQTGEFELFGKDFHWQLPLEADAAYRKAELAQVVAHLYRMGLKLRERDYLDRTCFLLRPTNPELIPQKIEELQSAE